MKKTVIFSIFIFLLAGCQSKSEDVKRSIAFCKDTYPAAKITGTKEEPYTFVMLHRFNYYAGIETKPEMVDMVLSTPDKVVGNMVTVNITMKGTNYEAVFLYQDGKREGNLLVSMN